MQTRPTATEIIDHRQPEAQNFGMISRDTRVNILIGNGHFLSHFYTLSLPPLFLFLQKDFDISFAQLGLVPVVMSIMAALMQTPYGTWSTASARAGS